MQRLRPRPIQSNRSPTQNPTTTGGHWEDAERCFQQMLSQGCSPDGITYSALITAFERGGQWRRALSAYAQMSSQVGRRGLLLAWRSAAVAVIDGCRPHTCFFSSCVFEIPQSSQTPPHTAHQPQQHPQNP